MDEKKLRERILRLMEEVPVPDGVPPLVARGKRLEGFLLRALDVAGVDQTYMLLMLSVVAEHVTELDVAVMVKDMRKGQLRFYRPNGNVEVKDLPPTPTSDPELN